MTECPKAWPSATRGLARRITTRAGPRGPALVPFAFGVGLDPDEVLQRPDGVVDRMIGVDRDLGPVERRAENDRRGGSAVAVHVVELVIDVAHVVLHAAGDADPER